MAESHKSSLSGAFRRPFTEQIAFWRRKLGNLVPTARWDDLWQDAHDHAFMVAGAMKADLLADLAAAVDRAIVEGSGYDAFRRDFREIVRRHGWHGWTGEGTRAGEAWRTRVIYRTNTRTSYMAGRRAQLVSEDLPIWIYRHGGSQEPRFEHLHVFDGLCLPPDHTFWTIYFPPSGWGCKCYVNGARSDREARRLGGDPDKRLPEGWDRPDPKTGLPPGIDRGWGYAPGASASDTVRAMAPKIRQWDHRIAKGFMESVPERLRDALARSYRALASVADDARRYAQRVLDNTGEVRLQPSWTLGLVTSDQARAIGELKGIDVSAWDFSIDRSAPGHVRREHGDDRAEGARGQQAVTSADYAMLPRLLNLPGPVVDRQRTKTNEELIEIARDIDGVRYVATFALIRGRRSLVLKTFRRGRTRPHSLRP